MIKSSQYFLTSQNTFAKAEVSGFYECIGTPVREHRHLVDK